jgi:hypothetical protein
MYFKPLFRVVLGCLLFGPLTGQGQSAPALEMDQLHRIEHAGERSVRSSAVSANLKVFCDGAFIFLYIHVRDPQVHPDQQAAYADHVELSLALPDEAFPADFEYDLHPRYVQAPPQYTSRSQPSPPRFFSVYSEYAHELDLRRFTEDFDYPQQPTGQLPSPYDLQVEEVHFGLMRFALFPDGRPAQLLNRDELRPVEQVLRASLGDVAAGIRYQVTHHADGSYEVNARLSPQALGFVPLPELGKLNLMVDVMDVPVPGQRALPTLSSARYRQPGRPATFNQVRFQKPLHTNFTTIPDALFQAADYHPICFFSRQDWISTGVDVDALVYREHQASQALTEVKFTREPFHYDFLNVAGTPVESLTIDFDYVNQIPSTREYKLLHDYLIPSEQVRSKLANSHPIENEVFRFPDGELGVIMVDNSTFDPYGWGDCGTCIEERITIHRVTDRQRRVLLEINQWDGPDAYCQVGPHYLEDYYVDRTDWIQPGRILVLRLNHRYTKRKKRVKITWNQQGEAVQTTLIDP